MKLILIVFGLMLNDGLISADNELNVTRDSILNDNFHGLALSSDCHEDIVNYCPTNFEPEDADLEIMSCFHNSVVSLYDLAYECQHRIYTARMEMTERFKNEQEFSVELKLCKDDLNEISACRTLDDDKSKFNCLLENKHKITNQKCAHQLMKYSIIVFSDYHFFTNFYYNCSKDIELFKCGRLSKSRVRMLNSKVPLVDEQSETINCLSTEYKNLEPSCQIEMNQVVELQSTDYHLDRAFFFACQKYRNQLCGNVTSGEGRVYKCLADWKFSEYVSKDCRSQILRRQLINTNNIKTDVPFTRACEKDLKANQCYDKHLFAGEIYKNPQYFLANVLLCLENASRNGLELEVKCKDEIFAHRKTLLLDYRLSANIVHYCADEIGEKCNGGVEKNGKTLQCLLNNVKLKGFTEDCTRVLNQFMKTSGITKNIRIDPIFYSACHNLIDLKCNEARESKKYGSLIACLSKELNNRDMKTQCRDRLINIQYFQTRDWTLNPQLFKACHSDAQKVCNAHDQWFHKSQSNEVIGNILPCLFNHLEYNPLSEQTNNKYLTDKCSIEVEKVIQIRADDIYLMPVIQSKCQYDLVKFCTDNIRSNNSRQATYGFEIKCLQGKFRELRAECREQIGNYSVLQRHDIRLDKMLMALCSPVFQRECTEKGDNNLNCLVRLKNHPDVSRSCAASIAHHQILRLESVWTKSEFRQQCAQEIQTFCSQHTSKLQIIYCLSGALVKEQMDIVETKQFSSNCVSEVEVSLLEVKEDINLDQPLLKACGDDVNKHCKANAGQGKLYECLRLHQSNLSLVCTNLMLDRRRIELTDVKTDYYLQMTCVYAIRKLCKEDQDTLNCLRKNLKKSKLNGACRETVIQRLIDQNKDIHFNKNLYRACKQDIQMSCLKRIPTEAGKAFNNSDVMVCLKEKLKQKRLNIECKEQILSVMRETAMVDYRLDVKLTKACIEEIPLCQFNPNKLDCLKLKLQMNQLPVEGACYKEVRRVISEGAVDIFVDPMLKSSCQKDLNKFCNEVLPGSSHHLNCLLENKKKLSPICKRELMKRLELWQVARIDNLTDLINVIKRSSHSTFIFYVFGFCLAFVFLVSLLCKPGVIMNGCLHCFKRVFSRRIPYTAMTESVYSIRSK